MYQLEPFVARPPRGFAICANSFLGPGLPYLGQCLVKILTFCWPEKRQNFLLKSFPGDAEAYPFVNSVTIKAVDWLLH